MAFRDYVNFTDEDLIKYINGDLTTDAAVNQTVSQIMSTRTNGIEGLPYQFMSTVDRRIPGTPGAGVGRKYGERIFSRLPLLFLTPCEPLFMDDFDKTSKQTATEVLLGNGIDRIGELINGTGKYYSVDFSYAEYYDYLNTMLAAVAMYTGLYDEKIQIGDKPAQKLGNIAWQEELNDSFKTFFSSQENIIFYLDGMERVDESFTNDTTESSLASTVNGFSDQANELRFLFGRSGSVASEIMNSATEVTSSITSSLSKALNGIGGGIVGSLADKGVNSVLNGGKIIFPEIWANSHFDRSYSINIKLRSPDHDSLSIFLNVIKPYCKLLCLTLPRQPLLGRDKEADPNGYSAPFLVKAYSKGLFNIDMGIITSLSASKGDTCQWNDDGLPTQIDITLEIKDLYSHMAMSTMFDEESSVINVVNNIKAAKACVNNTAYMDFLANMSGLNIAQMEVGRRIQLIKYLTMNSIAISKSRVFTRFDQSVSRLIGKMYNIL